MFLTELSAYLIIIICGFKMVRYVNLNTNLDGNLKRLNKQLTKVLILLVSIFWAVYTVLSLIQALGFYSSIPLLEWASNRAWASIGDELLLEMGFY